MTSNTFNSRWISIPTSFHQDPNPRIKPTPAHDRSRGSRSFRTADISWILRFGKWSVAVSGGPQDFALYLGRCPGKGVGGQPDRVAQRACKSRLAVHGDLNSDSAWEVRFPEKG